MNPSIAVPPPPPARSAEAHLEGLGTFVMLRMRQRIIERLQETNTIFWERDSGIEITQGDKMPNYRPAQLDSAKRLIARERGDFADWMIRRMAENRLRDGKKMDSIIAASYKAFLPNLMAQAIRTVE